MQPSCVRLARAPGLLLLAILLLALAGCSSPPPDCHSPEVFCVGFVTDSGGLKDYGPNEGAWQALVSLREAGLVVDVIESADSLDYEKNIAFFNGYGYDMIFTSGYSLAEATLAAAREHPNTAFVMIGQPPPADGAPSNLAGVVFSEQQAGYWAGALAAHFSESYSAGAVFANRDIPSVAAYAQGFQSGLRAVEASALQAQIVFYPDGKFADSLSDREWGLEQAELLYEQGADVLFAYGGLTGLAALEQFQGRVIGVEVDLARRYPARRDHVAASIVFDFSILQDIARAGRLDQPVYEGQYRVLWGDLPAPEVLEALDYPGDATLEELDDELQEELPPTEKPDKPLPDDRDGDQGSDGDQGYGYLPAKQLSDV